MENKVERIKALVEVKKVDKVSKALYHITSVPFPNLAAMVDSDDGNFVLTQGRE